MSELFSDDDGWVDFLDSDPEKCTQSAIRIAKAINLIVRFGGIDGDYHKAWVLDQVARRLLGPDYDQVVKQACVGEDGPNTYEWNVGIAP
jgi:hypothetical protein